MLRCAYFEIYNDQIFDLLNEDQEKFQLPLQAIEDIKKKEFVVRGLREVVVTSFNECLDLLKLGERNRSYAETTMNHASSRSHTVYRIFVESMPQLCPEDLLEMQQDASETKSMTSNIPEMEKVSTTAILVSAYILNNVFVRILSTWLVVKNQLFMNQRLQHTGVTLL